MFHTAFVCLSVHLSVCLLATSRKNYLSYLHENFTDDVSLHKEELVKYPNSRVSKKLRQQN